MTIKELAHAVQRDLQSATSVSFKRGHVYELLAAAFGFASYAALSSDHVFDVGDGSGVLRPSKDTTLIACRAQELKYTPVAAHAGAASLLALMQSRGLVVRNLDQLLICARRVRSLERGIALPDLDKDGNDENWLYEEEPLSAMLLDSLRAAATRGEHRAHYALALLIDAEDDELPSTQASAHWYSVQQSGQALTGVEKEWADAYAVQQERSRTSAFHLDEACRLGNPYALLDLAEQLDDVRYFDVAAALPMISEPRRMAKLAARFGRGDVVHWLMAAAEDGDTEAMRDLIEGIDAEDGPRCWAWIYFARLLGTDLMQSNMRAYHDGGISDGQAYDDDVGGPLYVSGYEGIELEPLGADADIEARSAGEQLFARWLDRHK